MIDRQYPRVHAKERCDVCWLPPGGFFKVRGRRQTSDEYPVRSVSRQGSHLKGLEWLAISHCPGPNLTATIPQEGVICVIHHSGLRLAEPELKVWRQSTEATGNTNLEVVLLGFAPHDDVERLVRVLGAALDAAGHVLLVLVGVEPHSEGSAVSSQLGPRLGSCDKWTVGRFEGQLWRREWFLKRCQMMLNFTSNIYTPNFLLLLKLFAMPQRAPMAQIYI